VGYYHKPRDSLHENRSGWDVPEIDGSVMVDESIPIGEFTDNTIGDRRGYDLVAAR